LLFWNKRIAVGAQFLAAYERLLYDFCPEYEFSDHRHVDDTVLTAFFAPKGYRQFDLPNVQYFDYEGLEGRLLSSSYAPLPPHPNHEPMIAKLKAIFEECQSEGKVAFEYETNVYIGNR